MFFLEFLDGFHRFIVVMDFFWVWASTCRVEGLGLVWGLKGLGFRVYLGFRV